jgi:chemotaxis protein methyltransferase CheR
VAQSIQATDYAFLRIFLKERIGHELGDGKEYLVVSRLVPVVETFRLETLKALFDRLRRTRDLLLEDAICEAMVTCETSFFRNPSVFERLRRSAFPTLLTTRASERRLRIWCAGCSTGQEPYSVAMLLHEHFPESRAWDVKILATDVSERVLKAAALGEFSDAEVKRGLGTDYLRTYFSKRNNTWVVEPVIRKRIHFEKFNLMSPSFHTSEFDIILIRNVLIYFTDEVRARIFASLRRALRDDGFLFLGESETILGQGDEFTFGEDGMDYYRPVKTI